MEWRRLGRIFDPTKYCLPNKCHEFAQSPQALVFDDYVRVYFSTRERDLKNGKFLSHVAFVDMAKDMRTILRIADKTVLPLGELGSFDEHGVFPINPLRHEGRVIAYTCGWSRRVSVSVETAIGLVISNDNGLTFQRSGAGPIMAASMFEPCLVGDGFVRVVDGVFHMWYIFGTGWRRFTTQSAPDRTYKIGHATSVDGVNWNKEEGRKVIADRLGEQESQALPTVMQISSAFHMFFCFRESFDFRAGKGRGYRIGHARSEDLSNWVRDDDEFSILGAPGEWDSDMQCYPHVFECDGRKLMLYNGNEFGRFGFGLAELK